jgi:pyrroloquinoline quinone (PQQ) biosynthesis protein C
LPFYDDLLADTESERAALLAIPFIREGAAGRLTRDQYLAFLEQAYHHVKHTLPLLMACGGRIFDSKGWLRLAMAEYIKEETGHEEWILNDIHACGGDPERVRHGRPGLAAELMVAYAYDTIHRRNPVGFLGMVLVLEGTSVQVAAQAARAIKKSLGLPDAAFTYLTSHGALDIEHTRFFASLVNRMEDPADREAVVHCAKVFYKLYGDIFRDLGRETGLGGDLREAA